MIDTNNNELPERAMEDYVTVPKKEYERLLHFWASNKGLYCTDRPDLFPEALREFLFPI